MRCLLPALLAVSPAIALACPTEADLERGILLTYASGDTELITRQRPDVLAMRYTATDGWQSNLLVGKGVYTLQSVDLENGEPDHNTRINYAFPVAPTELPNPKAGLQFLQTVIVSSSGDFEAETHAYSFAAIPAQTFGDCTYDAIEVKIAYQDQDNWVDTLVYFPALKLSYLAANEYDEDSGRTLDVFELVSLTTP
ncbi:hypothetical protein [Cognatishimia sp.]|uniref:hypothetical protein n=1 Tax=Cognatishimia sp. TaxID=2211648 RepID=UPI0035125A53